MMAVKDFELWYHGIMDTRRSKRATGCVLEQITQFSRVSPIQDSHGLGWYTISNFRSTPLSANGQMTKIRRRHWAKSLFDLFLNVNISKAFRDLQRTDFSL